MKTVNISHMWNALKLVKIKITFKEGVDARKVNVFRQFKNLEEEIKFI